MASTSTNKQPMLIDRVLHGVVDLAGSTISAGTGVDIGGTNTAKLIIDGTRSDGCIVEEVYSYSRGTDYTINLYISSAADYLRPQQGVYVGTFKSGDSEKVKAVWEDAPSILAPVPNTTVEDAAAGVPQYKALYVPKGKALWAAVVEATPGDQATTAPILGVQGGWY